MIKSKFSKILIFTTIFALLSVAFAQQITRFGVVDTARVYQSYYKNSTQVRNYEAKKSQYQKEIDKRTQELQDLQKRKVDLEKNENMEAVLKLEAEIATKADFLSEYTTTKNAELESMKNSLIRSDEFYKKLYRVLDLVAETEGYSMILSLQQSNGILWYSPSVDVTDRVIHELEIE